ncbi:MAG: hypothetical protein DRO88_05775 [Promethearchaeia archaeon]|nr:MAG: hypothetical protein DRO88_05775 [Candidatus Lokiarchaeia archaeon]
MPRRLIRVIDPESFHKKRTYYKNITRNSDELELVVITLEEYEAIRLYNYCKLSQAECAANLKVSQPTFSRILRNAMEKLAKALVENKDFEIIGGDVCYEDWYGWGCWDCDYEWKAAGRFDVCPKCNSKVIYRLKKIVTHYK